MTQLRPLFLMAVLGGMSLASGLGGQCTPATQRLITRGQHVQARSELDAQLKRAPNDDAVMDCIGRLRLDQGESADAVEWIEKAIAINDLSARHHLSLALALQGEAGKAGMMRVMGLAKRSMSEFDRAVTLDPALVEARYNLVPMLVQMPALMGGSIAKAREHSAELLKQHPMRGHFAYALVAEQEKDFAGAEKEFLAAIAVRPDSDVVYINAAAFYRGQERWNDAITMSEKQLKTISKDASATRLSSAHYFLGMANEKTGNGDKAKAEYQTAIATNPKNEDARKALARLGGQ